MPSTTPKQAHVMSAIAHGWRPSNLHIPVSVAKEFHEADKGKKWGAKADGGPIPLPRPRPNNLGEDIGTFLRRDALADEPGVPEVGEALPRSRFLHEEPYRGYRGEGFLRFPRGDRSFSTQGKQTIGDVLRAMRSMEQYRAMGGRAGYAGGGAPQAPWYERGAMYHLNRMGQGFLKSGVPGRTDKLNLNVGPGSYILPADTISHLGQNNSIAGAKVADRLFKTGMKGVNLGLKNRPRMGRMFMAAGGKSDHVPIMAAGGEYVLTPEQVKEVGGGDLDRGHKILDQFVLNVRKHHLKTLKALPKPKK